MSTAIVSDLHLSTVSGADMLRRPQARERLGEALSRADRVVILGDLLELRERRAEEALKVATPALEAIGEATAGRELVLVPGNHDYELASPALERERLGGRDALPLQGRYSTDHGELSRRVAALMPDTDVSLAYPGLRLRDDVFATHGHYLDLHLTVPRVESIFAHAVGRLVGAKGPELSVDAYEAALSPVYAFSHALAQSARVNASVGGGNISREVWVRAGDGGVAGLALGGVAIPVAVATLNRLGIGRFRPDISATELRRAGLRAMDRVIGNLDIEAAHVIFGHTHRAGPLPGEVEGWWLGGGTRLHNTGSWLLEEAFSAAEGPANPYWPGRVTWLDDSGPPWFENVLEGLEM
ncbi:MAG: metallophosphoesterase [Thermoleophilaceae bacterium]